MPIFNKIARRQMIASPTGKAINIHIRYKVVHENPANPGPLSNSLASKATGTERYEKEV